MVIHLIDRRKRLWDFGEYLWHSWKKYHVQLLSLPCVIPLNMSSLLAYGVLCHFCSLVVSIASDILVLFLILDLVIPLCFE